MTVSNVTIFDFYRIAWLSDRSWWWFELHPKMGCDRTLLRRLTGGEWTKEETVCLRNMQGSKLTDMPGNTLGIPIVSKRLRSILRDASHQDIVGSPCEIRQKDDSLIGTEVFFLFDIPVGCGRFDLSRGRHLLYTDYWKTDPWLRDAVGTYFDVSTWSGHGVFFSESSRSEVLVHKSVAHAIEQAQLCGVEIIPLVEIGREIRDAMVEQHRQKGII